MSSARMPLSAVGMIAAHLYLEHIKRDQMLPRDLDRISYGNGRTGYTFRDKYADYAAKEAWKIAQAVVDAEPEEP